MEGGEAALFRFVLFCDRDCEEKRKSDLTGCLWIRES